MIHKLKKIYNDLIIDLENSRRKKEYQHMGDIYTEMENLRTRGFHASSTYNENIRFYFAPLMDDGDLQLPYDLVCRAGIQIYDTLMLKILVDEAFNYTVSVEKIKCPLQECFSLHNMVSKYNATLDKNYIIQINKKAREQLCLKQDDIIQIILFDDIFILSKYETPIPYLVFSLS